MPLGVGVADPNSERRLRAQVPSFRLDSELNAGGVFEEQRPGTDKRPLAIACARCSGALLLLLAIPVELPLMAPAPTPPLPWSALAVARRTARAAPWSSALVASTAAAPSPPKAVAVSAPQEATPPAGVPAAVMCISSVTIASLSCEC